MQRKWRRDWERGKSHNNPFKRLAVRILPPVAAVGIFLNSIGVAYALPTGVTVTNGTATVSQTGETMNVNQTSNKLIVNSNTFNIAANETLNLYQPSSSSSALWRVIGNDASSIYGHVNANGHLYLINSNGILFAPGAQVNVGGIVASTLNISDKDFQSGNYTFIKDGTAGSVVNQGTITATNYAVLLGPQVKNEGVIAARVNGLAAGNAVSLDFDGDNLLNVTVNTAAAGGSATNSGQILANGGMVIMSAGTKDALLDTVVNNSGVIQAQSVNNVNGVIYLEGNNTTVSGTLDASGKTTGQIGGTVKVLGNTVTLADGAKVDVSGDKGGGTALVGGNFHGQGPEQNATTTTVAKNATINADAITSGNGGNVAVWANDTTAFNGSISAKGGATSGNGGQVETSGHNKLTVGDTARVSTAAAHGTAGNWLLDPADFTIAASGGDMSGATIGTNLANGNVTILSSQGASGTNGDINVNDAVAWSNSNTLTLSAYRDVNVNNTITGTGGGNLVLRADNTGAGTATLGTGHGIVNLNANISLTGGTGSNVNNVSIYYDPVSYTDAATQSTSTTTDGTTFTTINPYKTGGKVVYGNLTAYMLVNNLNDLTNIGSTTTNLTNLSGVYALSKDIDASSTKTMNWNPIGTNPGTGGTPFTGTFDGGGHVISGLYINSPSSTAAGLFGYANYAKLRNLGLENVNITARVVGALAARFNYGTVTNCYSTGTLTGTNYVGGLLGTTSQTAVMGGITNSYSTATINVTGTNLNVGGLIANSSSNDLISNCYSTGTVTVTNNGTSQGIIGGLVGFIVNGSIQNSYSTGAVTVTATKLSPNEIGGLVGAFSTPFSPGIQINNSYSTSPVTYSGAKGWIGGLAGGLGYVAIANSYSTGLLTVTNNLSSSYPNTVGGLIGGGTGIGITNSYWDTQTSGISNITQGVGDTANYAGVNGLTTDQFRNANNFANWSIVDTNQNPASYASYTWVIVNGSTRPFLVSEYNKNIRNAHQLQLMAMDPTAHYTLANNLDLSGNAAGMWSAAGFVPVGNATTAFSGSLDGTGHTVTGLTINSPAAPYSALGLFGYTSSGANIQDIGLIDAKITGGANNTYVGSLVGYNGAGSTITNAYSYSTGTGSISGTNTVGGLVGANRGTIQYAYSATPVSGGTVGGLVGDGTGGTIVDSVWNTTVSNQSQGVGNGAGTNSVTGLTTTDMANQAKYPGTWDFSNTWVLVNGQPHLLREYNGARFISSLADLQLLYNNLSGTYVLTTNINIGNWTPVGTSAAPFTGTLLGYGNTLSGLTISGSWSSLGLFGYTQGATISNLNLAGVNITAGTGNTYVGSLVGYAGPGSSIISCSSTGTIMASGTGSSVGGLVGYNNAGMLSFATNAATVTGTGANDNVGGLAGYNAGTLANSTNTANVTGSGVNSNIGGLAGYNASGGTITNNSYNAGAVTAGGTVSKAGGLAGWNASGANITSSYGAAAGTVTSDGDSNYIGGLAGQNDGTITNSYNNSAVTTTVNGTNNKIGGLAGINNSTAVITGAYNAGTVTAHGAGANGRVGGLFGLNNASLTGLYNTGYVTSDADGNYVGGLVGENTSNITQSYNSSTVATTANGTNNIVGGLAGLNGGNITNSYGSGAVLALGAGNKVGGLVGQNAGKLQDVYSMVVTSGTGAGSTVGGLVGYNTTTGNIKYAFNVGETTGNGTVGGLVGRNDGKVTTALWATDTSGQSTGIAPGGAGTASGVQGLAFSSVTSPNATSTMLQSANYTGWNTSNWGIVNGVLPYLNWQYSVPLSPALTFTGTVQNGTGQTINILYNGTQIAQAHAFGANGWYYGAGLSGLSPLNTNGTVLLYVTGDSNYKAASEYYAGSNGLSGGNLFKNTLYLDGVSSSHLLDSLPTIPSTADSFYTLNNSSQYGGNSLNVTGSLILNTPGDFWLNNNWNGYRTYQTPLGNQQIIASGDITINAGGNIVLRHGATNYTELTAGGNITLVAGTGFVNSSGPTALSAGGRWLVYAPDQLIYASNRELYYFATFYAQMLQGYAHSNNVVDLGSASNELTYDARGGLVNNFTLWGTAYNPNVAPANAGNGFIFTAAAPAFRPLTPTQIERREAITAVQSDPGHDQKRSEPAASPVKAPAGSTENLPFLTITDEGVALE